jgi:hypothetical protein
MADGERETQKFLRSRSDPNSDIWEFYRRGYQPQPAKTARAPEGVPAGR